MYALTKSLGAERVPVLMYHRVEPVVHASELRYAVTCAQFAAHLDWLAGHGWQPCSLSSFMDWYLDGSSLPERSVLITFDDGFAGLHSHVLPLLKQRHWPAAVFLVSALIGGCEGWLAREGRGEASAHALLSAAQIAEMQAVGFEFHSHSRHHARLPDLDEERLLDEVSGSRAELQKLLGQPVDAIAYPYGRVDERVRLAVEKAGYRLGFSVDPGFNRPRGPALAVRRLDITGFDTPARFGRKITLGTNDGSLASQLRYVGRRLSERLRLAAAGASS